MALRHLFAIRQTANLATAKLDSMESSEASYRIRALIKIFVHPRFLAFRRSPARISRLARRHVSTSTLGRALKIDMNYTRLGRLEVLKRLLHAAAYRRPDAADIGLKRRAAHFVRCVSHLELFRDWLGNSANPALQQALLERPSLVTRVLHPYLNANWPFGRKVATIVTHYDMLHGSLFFLRFPAYGSITLADLGEAVVVRLDKPGRFEHEGELAINLFRDDRRLFSLVFTLGQIDGQRVVYAGGLQGINSPDALESYRLMTHQMHGMRPRDMLVTVFTLLCTALGVSRILTISDSSRVCSRPYFNSSRKVFTSYDSVWIEHGGVAGEDGFFELPARYAPRAAVDIPTRKRALYRRRYAMIDNIAAQIDSAVANARGCPTDTEYARLGPDRSAAFNGAR